MALKRKRRSLRLSLQELNGKNCFECVTCSMSFAMRGERDDHLIGSHLLQMKSASVKLRRLSDWGEISKSVEAASDALVLKRLSAQISCSEPELVAGNYRVDSPMSFKRLVFFDLETSGLSRASEILEIAAICGDKRLFDVYCMPTKPIPKIVSGINKLTVRMDKDRECLYYREKRVEAGSLVNGMEAFLSYLEGLPGKEKAFLVAHNANFDARFLVRGAIQLGLHERLSARVEGFLDTIPMFKAAFPSLGHYRQKTLVSEFLGENTSYDSHNALSDVVFLQKLFRKQLETTFSPLQRAPFSFSLQFALKKHAFNERVDENLPSFDLLIRKKVISADMARKMSGHKIRLDHLVATFRVEQEEGIRTLLSALNTDGKPRITRSEMVINRIIGYLKKRKAR